MESGYRRRVLSLLSGRTATAVVWCMAPLSWLFRLC